MAVPIHDLKNTDLLVEVVNQTKMEAIIVSQKVLPLLLKSLKECSTIKTIIVAGIYFSVEQSKVAADHGAQLVKFARVQYDGSWSLLEPVKPGQLRLVLVGGAKRAKERFCMTIS